MVAQLEILTVEAETPARVAGRAGVWSAGQGNIAEDATSSAVEMLPSAIDSAHWYIIVIMFMAFTRAAWEDRMTKPTEARSASSFWTIAASRIRHPVADLTILLGGLAVILQPIGNRTISTIIGAAAAIFGVQLLVHDIRSRLRTKTKPFGTGEPH